MEISERARKAALLIVAKFPKPDQERLLNEHELGCIEEGFLAGYKAGCQDQYAKDHTRTSDETFSQNNS